ncbi:MAG: DNA primase, partial [Prevotella sp.]|nr:DNA primase [Prevotella sp.]
LTTFTCVHKETKERIKWDDYKRLSQDEQEKYNVYPKMQVFRVFNVQQTNLKEARPELWQKLEQEYSKPIAEKGEQYAFEPVDRMITDNRWICPIKPTYGDSAYYSISKNEIVVPEKPQFRDGESFYGTAFHEMAHSTGAEGQLNRIKPSAFGSAEYAREELVAELTAALTAQRYGMTKNLKDDSAAYLKSWLDSLKESPQFIKTTLLDVKKAASMLTQHIDKMAVEIENEKRTAQTEEIKNDNGAKDNKNTGQVYYASVAYLQSADDTSKFDELKEKGDGKGILALAREYYDGNGMDEEQTYKSACKERGDFLLTEDNDFAVVFNGIISGTYEIYLKHTEQEVRDHVIRYGIGRASEDVKEVAREMVAEEFSEMERRKLPVFQMPDGGLLNLQYDKVNDNLDVGTVMNAGFSVRHSFQYDHDNSLDMNIQEVYRQLSEMPEYRQKDEEQEEHVAKSAFRR